MIVFLSNLKPLVRGTSKAVFRSGFNAAAGPHDRETALQDYMS